MESDSDADFEGKEDFPSKQEFNKLQRNLLSSGYREGAVAGKDAAFQSGFDSGFAEGFKTAFSLGKLNGAVESLRRNAEAHSVSTQELDGLEFENARHGLCQICKGSSEQSSCSCKKTQDMNEIITLQRELVTKALDNQRSKCHEVFERVGLNSIVSDDLK